MKNIKRRSLLKLAGIATSMIKAPWIHAQVLSEDSDVQFLKKEHKLFDVHRLLFNKRLNLSPNVIAVCKTELGVQKAVQYANDNELIINMKSGGHSFEGFSLNNGGLVIDLSQMNKIEIDSNHKLIAEPAVRLA